MFKLDLEKAEEPEIKLSLSTGLLKKQENSRINMDHNLVQFNETMSHAMQGHPRQMNHDGEF